ncbi:cell division protein FtsB [Deinococcus koreensis]|uniref:Cell division protein FtsB n=2 Tax=Deinococcus koreensis TaxID=2054903 RepID=A0A2K3UX82_9DEIO|nr:cell division protein FtsB [Deinococcus koreensis]
MLARMDDAPPSVPPRPRGSWWRRAARLPLALMLTSLLAALGIVQLSFQLANTGYRTLSWTQQHRQTEARIAALESDIRILQDARAAANDPQYLRQLARCQGFVGADEKVVVSPSAPDVPGENCQMVRLP